VWEEAIEAHYRAAWGAEGEVRHFSAGRISELPVDFVILRYPPSPERNPWIYATCGMSQPGDKKPTELHMFSPLASSEIEELLVVTAHFHRTAAILDVGHSVNFGRPWLRGSNCDHGLVSLPYLSGPSLENLQVGSDRIKCYWLIPLTLAEVTYKQQHGLEALEQALERANIDYLDHRRMSVVH
jgi:hypothetical protein